ncbi:MAG: hypothetical protein ACKPJJ_08145, partial [Planctomycetaceae bacterium]
HTPPQPACLSRRLRRSKKPIQVQSPVPETPESLAHTRDTPDPGYMGHPARWSVFRWLKWTCGLWGIETSQWPESHATALLRDLEELDRQGE